MNFTLCKSNQFNFIFDKEILCTIIKGIDIRINTKWTGMPSTFEEIEQILNKKNWNNMFKIILLS